VSLQFHSERFRQPWRARTIKRGDPWGELDDLALLELEDEVAAARDLARCRRLMLESSRPGERFFAQGYPDDYVNGQTIGGRVLAPQGQHLLELRPDEGFHLRKQFSGTPLWSSDQDCCLGIVHSREEGWVDEQFLAIPSSALQKFWLTGVCEAVFHEVDSHQLHAMLEALTDEGITVEGLRSAFIHSRPADGDDLSSNLRDRTSTLAAAVYELADAPRQSTTGRVPLQCFLLYVLDLIRDEEHATAIERFLEHVGSLRSWPPPAACPDPSSSEQLQIPSILLKIDPPLCPDQDGSGPSTLTAFLAGTRAPGCFAREELESEETRASLLHAILVQALRLVHNETGIDPRDVEFRFILPKEDLGLEVDRWEVEVTSSVTVPLGAHSPVVVGLLERQQSWYRHASWTQRWNDLQRAPVCEALPLTDDHEAASSALRCFSGPIANKKQLALQLLGDPVAVAILLNPPDQYGDLIDQLIGTGTPVILWPREEILTESQRGEFFRELLERTELTTLPERLRNVRRAAHLDPQGTSEIGLHVTLFWDDPYKTLLDYDAPFMEPQ
jgi:hypothetical protein